MKLSALNENGKPVDWWFLYKVPKLTANKASKNPQNVASATGYEYVYYDPSLNAVHLSKNVLTDGKGALDLTLNSVFNKPGITTGWVLYNDEMPASADRKDDGSMGHTKGVIAFDTASQTAFWLLHSWPKYANPGVPISPGTPTPLFGQTFICISLGLATAGKITAQMAGFQQPQSYLPHMPPSLPKSGPLYRITQPLNPNVSGNSDDLPFTSLGGLKFHVIAKNRLWGKDFWNDLVADKIKENIDVDSWIRGKNEIPPGIDEDGIYKTFDIKFIDLRPLGTQWAWPETKDHAKWAISYKDNWVCVGDMNRMISQEKRGGGTIALQNATLWQALKKTDLIVPPPGMNEGDARDIINQANRDAGARVPAHALAAAKAAHARAASQENPAGPNNKARS
jgi:deoxyribonuclease-2